MSGDQLLGTHIKLLAPRHCMEHDLLLAGISENIKEKPVGVEILGEKVVLFRGADGKVHCLNDVCPHRGAPLHQVLQFDTLSGRCGTPTAHV